MTTATSWRPFPSSPSSEAPRLLVSMETGPANYSIHLSDLAHVWTETLDRRNICRRAWDLNTSIDPSDTPENMSKFLQSLSTALDPDAPGHEQTSLALWPASKSDAATDGLLIKISCEIPGLETLRWEMKLDMAPASAIAPVVVLPLLQAQYMQSREIDSLVSLLKKKDEVLARLLDKLEATGTGLENVFASLSSRKRISREAAYEKVTGLAPFRQASWRDDLRDTEEPPSDMESLVHTVFAGKRPNSSTSSLPSVDSTTLDRWWHDLSGTTQAPHRGRPKRSPPKTAKTPVADDDADGDDADFQVQPTPPKLGPDQRSVSKPSASLADDASTAREDEAPPPSGQAKNTAKRPQVRLGGVGGKKMASTPASPSPEPISHKSLAESVDHDETASEASDDDATAAAPDKKVAPSLSEGDSMPSRPAEKPSTLSPIPTPKKGGLGRIGARKQAVQEHNGQVDERPEMRQSPKKLGGIGKRTTAASGDQGVNKARGRPQETSPDQDAPRETSQERADRKREEIKKELERKAAAGPAKKKRRF